MARLPFIDVGDSQGSVDWDRVRQQGKAVLAACKATEGETFRAKTFSAARVHTRVDAEGVPILLDAQDRAKWNRELIREGMERGGVLSRLRTVVPAGTTPTRGDL